MNQLAMLLIFIKVKKMINGYGICLNEWLEDEAIKTELRLLIKISSLTAEKGFCYASNSFFAEYFKTSDVTISKQIKKLEKLNYIDIEYEKRGAEVIKRNIRLKKTLTDDYQKLKPTIKENFKENITSINIISNNIDSFLSFIPSEQTTLIKYAKDFIEYRKSIKDKIKTDRPIKLYLKNLSELKKDGYDINKCIEEMKAREWKTIDKSYLKNRDDLKVKQTSRISDIDERFTR